MANEATLIVEKNYPVNFTVANATGIEKGAILKMTDPMTAIINSAANDTVAGIAAAEKIASDGVTKLAVYRDGIFKVTVSGAVTVGDPLGTSATVNMLRAIPSVLSGAKIIGYALETGATGDTILMDMNIHSNGGVL